MKLKFAKIIVPFILLSQSALAMPIGDSDVCSSSATPPSESDKLSQNVSDISEKLTDAEYSINTMWVNREKDPKMKYVFPEKHAKTNIEQTLFDWAEKNPKAVVNIWHDSEFETQEAIERTKELIDKYNLDHSRGKFPVVLKDIRELETVKKHPKVFSSQTPTYFRLDLLRLIATHEAVTQNSNFNFVYADLDVTPMNRDELFDEETKENLKKYGMVVTRGGWNHDMENSFHIVSSGKPNIHEAISSAAIEANINRAYGAMNGNYFTYDRPHTKALAQVVYDSYPPMFRYFYHLEGLGTLSVDKEDEDSVRDDKETYDKAKHGLRIFGIPPNPKHYIFGPDNSTYIYNPSFTTKAPEIWDKEEERIIIPTKKVTLPSAKGTGYY